MAVVKHADGGDVADAGEEFLIWSVGRSVQRLSISLAYLEILLSEIIVKVFDSQLGIHGCWTVLCKIGISFARTMYVRFSCRRILVSRVSVFTSRSSCLFVLVPVVFCQVSCPSYSQHHRHTCREPNRCFCQFYRSLVLARMARTG